MYIPGPGKAFFLLISDFSMNLVAIEPNLLKFEKDFDFLIFSGKYSVGLGNKALSFDILNLSSEVKKGIDDSLYFFGLNSSCKLFVFSSFTFGNSFG